MLDDLLDEEMEELDAEVGAAVGIDLGTTNSVISCVTNEGPIVFQDGAGHRLHPSIVSWLPGGGRVVGQDAKLRRVIDPANTVYSAKRIIGQPFRAQQVQEALKYLPYQVVEGEQQESLIVTREGNVPVTQVSAYVLGALRTLGRKALGRDITHCVVTVPANFTDAQRAATRRAATLAGMDVLRILNEPTAAAIAYGRDRPMHQRIAVYDLGGGTFDLTLLAVRGNLYEVIATGGDAFLGGDDFDHLLAKKLSDQFLAQHRIDPSKDPIAKSRLLIAAEQIKMRLSDELVVEGSLSEIAHGAGGKPLGLSFRIERAEFEQMIKPIVDRSIDMVHRVLGAAQITPQQVDEVILVGGSTRVPLVPLRVAEVFGQNPRCDLDPMEVVAMGAALQAHGLSSVAPVAQAPVLFDVTPHSLRVVTVGGFTKVLVPKNTTIPAEGTGTFYTAADNQDNVRLVVCQGEEGKIELNIPLGELRLDNLPLAPRGQVAIDVAFTIDADGILQVSAREQSTGKKTQATLTTVGLKEER
jgi:molecular chaperone DnaK